MSSCNICGENIAKVIDLPQLPFTGEFRKPNEPIDKSCRDQAFYYCESCGHGQLENSARPEDVYKDTYLFRSAESKTSRSGCDFFINFLRLFFPKMSFNRIVEFGCNDCYALKKLKGAEVKLLGVDLIFADKKNYIDDSEIMIAGKSIENTDFSLYFNESPDFVFSRHTMEHILSPRTVIEKLFSMTSEDTIFAFEFPCLDILLKNGRFDQIFHQHVNYYSEASFLKLMEDAGAEVIGSCKNWTLWGALIVIVRKKGKKTGSRKYNALRSINDIAIKYALFQKQMEICGTFMNGSEALYGFGAAQMLPVLKYHLGESFSNLKWIFDDDPAKAGLKYKNLDLKICSPDKIDFSKKDILLTALDSSRMLMCRLASLNPRRIINPLNVM